ncbi:DeoR family transcriptional regulator [Sandarakinorhabdus sp.]|uniref:DeoR family transcriptional regulator n=1 Tax=Sandarakinorhabdus sp. TaxID=1916663 RepID=UPI00333E73BB
MRLALAGPVVPAPDPGPPLRSIGRTIDAWLLDIVSGWFRFFGGDTLMVEIYHCAMVANTQHLLGDAMLAVRFNTAPVTPVDCRPVSVAAIAVRLGIDYTTVRRNVTAMREAGQCFGDRHGVIVDLAGAPAFIATPGGVPAQLALLATQLQERVIDNGYDVAAVAELRNALDLDFTRLAAADTLVTLLVANYIARVMLPSTSLFGADRDSAAIFLTIYVENSRSVAADPGLSHADGWIDRELLAVALRPISVTEIAIRLGMNNETVRRKTNRLIDKGMVQRVVGGVVVIRTLTLAPVHAPLLYQELLTMLAQVKPVVAVG